MMHRSLLRGGSAIAARVGAPRNPSMITNVRHFRQTAPAKKQVSGIAGVIEADNATFTTKVYHWTNVGLLGLTPVAFILSPSVLSVPVDYALAVVFPVHAHIGMNCVISDYVPPQARTLARVAWLGVTAVMFLGLMRVNIEGPGVTESIKTIWRENPNKKKQE